MDVSVQIGDLDSVIDPFFLLVTVARVEKQDVGAVVGSVTQEASLKYVLFSAWYPLKFYYFWTSSVSVSSNLHLYCNRQNNLSSTCM